LTAELLYWATDVADNDADSAFCPFDPNELVEKLAIVHARPSSENRSVSRFSSWTCCEAILLIRRCPTQRDLALEAADP